MKAFTIEHPPCEPWVTAEWDSRGAMFAVSCKHCGGMDYAFVPYLRREPEAAAEWVTHHNGCKVKEGE